MAAEQPVDSSPPKRGATALADTQVRWTGQRQAAALRWQCQGCARHRTGLHRRCCGGDCWQLDSLQVPFFTVPKPPDRMADCAGQCLWGAIGPLAAWMPAIRQRGVDSCRMRTAIWHRTKQGSATAGQMALCPIVNRRNHLTTDFLIKEDGLPAGMARKIKINSKLSMFLFG